MRHSPGRERGNFASDKMTISSGFAHLAAPPAARRSPLFRGHKIPAGTQVYLFAGAVHGCQHFQPERHLDESGQFRAAGPPLYAFGAGKRRCVGEALTRVVALTFLSRICRDFHLTTAEETFPAAEMSAATTRYPWPPEEREVRLNPRQGRWYFSPGTHSSPPSSSSPSSSTSVSDTSPE